MFEFKDFLKSFSISERTEDLRVDFLGKNKKNDYFYFSEK